MASRTASYIRIGASAGIWFLIQEKQPHTIGAVLAADAAICIAVSVLVGHKSLADRLLSHVADVMIAATIIFSALFKQKMTELDWYSQMWNQDWLGFRSCMNFSLYFCARWFNNYALILAGDRRDRIGT